MLDENLLEEAVDIGSYEPEVLKERFLRWGKDRDILASQVKPLTKEAARAKMALDQLRAGLRISVRETMISGGIKPTEALIDDHVETNADYLKAKEHAVMTEIEAKSAHERVRNLDTVGSMLQQLGAMARLEMEADPVVRERMRVRKMRQDE